MGQLSRRAAWAGFREPRKDREEERQRPRSSAGKGVAVLSLRARTQGRARAGVQQWAGCNSQGSSLTCASVYQVPPHFS